MELKKVNPQKVFYHAEVTTMNDIKAVAEREIDNLCKEAEDLGLKESGPLHFVYYGCCDKPDTKFTLEIALVVDQEKPYNGKYRFKELEKLTCVTTTHHGDINKIGETYEMFMTEIYKSGKHVTDQSREVYHKWISPESPDNITEIQVGIN